MDLICVVFIDIVIDLDCLLNPVYGHETVATRVIHRMESMHVET